MRIYKIKVGIEEFEIAKDDVPRVLRAMQTDDIVMLTCGAFRGKSILAVTPVDKPDPVFVIPTDEEIIERLQVESALECKICTGNRYAIVKDQSGERIAKQCLCQNVKIKFEAEKAKIEKLKTEFEKKVMDLAISKKIS